MADRAGTHRNIPHGREVRFDLPAAIARLRVENHACQLRVQFIPDGDDVRIVISYPGRRPPFNPHEQHE